MKKSLIFLLFVPFFAACNGTPYNADDYANGGADAPYYNERTSEFMDSSNEYAEIDSARPLTDEQKNESNRLWSSSRMETRWQEYRGAMVRVQILLGNSELRRMRLRMIQSADGMDIDGDARSVLAHVADFEMKRVCGRNVENIAIIYDEPSFEVMRPTPFFDYRIEAEGPTMREYGFRCVYNKTKK
ncbi:MAG: hypothetical protein J6W41_02090 [Alphaproteobacteria bacterium]|nr:hypothetical protein [Alphaproteobacteria bacterium]